MQRRTLPRSALCFLAAFIVLIVVGNVIPPLVISSLKPVEVGTEYTYRSETSKAQLFDVASYQHGRVPPAHRTQPECKNNPASPSAGTASGTGAGAGTSTGTGAGAGAGTSTGAGSVPDSVSGLPLKCFIISADLRGERTTRTLPGKNNKYAVMESSATIHATPENPESERRGGVDTVVMSLQDSAVLVRHSGYAEAEPSSSTQLELPFAGVNLRKENYVRDGLQYVFPFTAKRISYPYWDVIAQKATALDYVDPVETPSGVLVWEYGQTLTALPLESTLTFEGTASQYFTAQELEDRHLTPDSQVKVSPFYSVHRRVQIEPKTGIMTNHYVDISVVLDLDQKTAQRVASRKSETNLADAAESRTLFRGSQTWDNATQEEAFQRIRPLLKQLKLFQVLSFISSTLIVVLLIWCAWYLIQWRRRVIRDRAAISSRGAIRDGAANSSRGAVDDGADIRDGAVAQESVLQDDD